ncbi:MAG: hypothetical protein IT445_05460 [Phycisphaeraceae bacterium]|nr:hypothetical protein [Phycisphaeraceae bacterium]
MRRFIIPAVVVVVIVWVAYQALTTQRGATYVSVGLSTPPEYQPYCDAARAELRTWLAQRGFSAEPSRGQRSSGARKERVEWFVGQHADSQPFHVVLIIPEGGDSGVHAHVEWFFRGLSFRVAASDRRAQEFAEMLRDWFQDYERRHPLQKNAAKPIYGPACQGAQVNKTAVKLRRVW